MKRQTFTLPESLVGVYKRDKSDCLICGQNFIGDDLICLVFHPETTKKNFFAHEEHWLKFSDGLSDDELVAKLSRHKKPRKVTQPTIDEELLSAYRDYISSKFYKVEENNNRIYFKRSPKRGKEAKWYLDKRTEEIIFTGVVRDSFVDAFNLQFTDGIKKEVYKSIGKDYGEVFTIGKLFKQANEEVDKMMGKRK